MELKHIINTGGIRKQSRMASEGAPNPTPNGGDGLNHFSFRSLGQPRKYSFTVGGQGVLLQMQFLAPGALSSGTV